MLLMQNPTPQIETHQHLGLDPALAARVRGFEQSKDWAALADFMEGLDPKVQETLLEPWMRALRQTDRNQRLLQVCESALDRDRARSPGGLSTVRLYRATALSRLGRHAEASAAHEENGRLGDPFGLRNACAAARAAADWERVERLALVLEGRVEFRMDALLWKGEALFRQTRLAEAEGPFELVLQVQPLQPYALAMLGACRAARQAYPEALAALDQAIAGDPALAEPYFNRALVRFALKQYREGKEDLLRAQRLPSLDPVLRSRVAENLALADQVLRARRPGPR